MYRDLSMQSDPRAPIEASAAQKASIERRRNITARKGALDRARSAGDKSEIAAAKAALDQRRRALRKLALVDELERYFAEAKGLRAQGRSTTELQERSRPSRHMSLSVDDRELIRL